MADFVVTGCGRPLFGGVAGAVALAATGEFVGMRGHRCADRSDGVVHGVGRIDAHISVPPTSDIGLPPSLIDDGSGKARGL